MSAPEDTREEIEVDPNVIDNEDADSALDAQSQTESTASITSSILEYRNIHGRTYQSSKTTEYWAPNDEQHVEGFDVGHHRITMMLDDKLYLAPIGDNPQVGCLSYICTMVEPNTEKKILDIGTGTGIWAIDMAVQFPSTHIIGTDISPTQPAWVPPNVDFQIDDAQLEWNFEPKSFDFIHIRSLHGAINDWPKLYRRIYRFLKPGGWFQHMEPGLALRCDNPDINMNENHVFKQWSQLFYDAGERLSRTFYITDKKMEEWARQAGFTDVVPKTFKLPYGGWPKDKKLKELGRYVNYYMDMSLGGFATYPMSELLGWSFEEITILVAQMRAAIHDQKSLPNGDMYVTYGRKPEEASKTTQGETE
ncbi:hypothetical protein QQZ08_004062 [Neonectria magnoliae]|uniref:S-adenosyl-L-methionine-dependent methyltransferase n=1 Tax=Neonectria magnoliae TaxID=2732573 RepID=A0ABR1I8Z4_9HYPO